MNPLAITEYTVTSALGAGRDANRAKLVAGSGGLIPCDFAGIDDLQTWVGEVRGLDTVHVPPDLAAYDCRNNRLSWHALQQDGFVDAVGRLAARYGPRRIGVYIGTSTSGIHATELAYRELAPAQEQAARLPGWYHYAGSHNTYSAAEFVRLALGLEGVCAAVSTACSSSAKVFASAQRAIHSGFCDAAVIGGVDSLCLTTLYGFHSLQLVASDVCRPADARREGLSIGEAAGFAILEKGAAAPGAPLLLGYGESSDAHHMSAPDPAGAGAAAAMQAALRSGGLDSAAVDYINLHGTGTRSNDTVESLAVQRVFPQGTPCSSTKGYTGHTLGAAGIVEAAFSLLCMEQGLRPASLNTRELDPAIGANVLLQPLPGAVHTVLSNSFGFGGTNGTIVMRRFTD